MKNVSSIMSAVVTYSVGVLMILYAIIYRGQGANDWSGATIMMFIAVMGMCLQCSIDAHRDSSV